MSLSCFVILLCLEKEENTEIIRTFIGNLLPEDILGSLYKEFAKTNAEFHVSLVLSQGTETCCFIHLYNIESDA